ncbi:MAG: hypothetical protein GYA86_04105, partial [Firmicutes bacterium]|nr:hypothetical protein [Bacillota bacterium]
VRAERYTGPGHQGMDDGSYLPLKRGDRQLYNLIADTYILSFLPMAGEMVPLLKIEPKDSSGNVVPLEELDKLIVRVDGEELKVWQTVIEYAAGQPLNEQGIAQIDPYYAETAGRINQIRSIPFLLWPALVLLVLVALIVILVRRRSRLKRERKPVVT